MSNTRTFILISTAVAQNAASMLANLPTDGTMEAVFRPVTKARTSAENRLLHALISEVAAKVEWAGKKRDAEIWKRLLVASWCRVHGESVEILPALDGHGVDIVPARTSKLSKKECADLIEYIYAWGADNGIMWPLVDGSVEPN